MSYDPNQPQPPDSGQPGQPQQPPYGQPQPPYGQPGQPQQPPYEHSNGDSWTTSAAPLWATTTTIRTTWTTSL